MARGLHATIHTANSFYGVDTLFPNLLVPKDRLKCLIRDLGEVQMLLGKDPISFHPSVKLALLEEDFSGFAPFAAQPESRNVFLDIQSAGQTVTGTSQLLPSTYSGLGRGIPKPHQYRSVLRSSIDQPLEAGMAVLVQCHDFAVKDCRTLQLSQRFYNQWKSFLEIILLAAIQGDVASMVSFRNRPKLIPLQLKQPAFAVKRIADQSGHHGVIIPVPLTLGFVRRHWDS